MLGRLAASLVGWKVVLIDQKPQITISEKPWSWSCLTNDGDSTRRPSLLRFFERTFVCSLATESPKCSRLHRDPTTI
jgi:hypothetical protein